MSNVPPMIIRACRDEGTNTSVSPAQEGGKKPTNFKFKRYSADKALKLQDISNKYRGGERVKEAFEMRW